MDHIYLGFLHSIGMSQKKLALISPSQDQYFFETVNINKLLQLGINEDTARKIVDRKSAFNVERVEHILQAKNIRIIHKTDLDYPVLLANTIDAPTILYVRGVLPTHDALLSVVGSRRHSSYAQSCLEKIIPDMIRHGYVIVS